MRNKMRTKKETPCKGVSARILRKAYAWFWNVRFMWIMSRDREIISMMVKEPRGLFWLFCLLNKRLTGYGYPSQH